MFGGRSADTVENGRLSVTGVVVFKSFCAKVGFPTLAAIRLLPMKVGRWC